MNSCNLAVQTSPLAIEAMPLATRASSDGDVLTSWVESLTSAHSRRNFGATGNAFLTALGMNLRAATVEDVREALTKLTVAVSKSTGRQNVLRVKSLLSYEHRLGYLQFNAGAVLKVRSSR